MLEQTTATDPFEAMRAQAIEEERLANAPPPVLTNPDMAAPPTFLGDMSPVVLCSIWPEKLISQPFSHAGAGRRRYIMEPGTPANPSTKVFQSTWMTIHSSEGGPDGDRITDVTKNVPAIRYVEDMVKHWTGDLEVPEGAQKGIGIIRGMKDGLGEIVPTPSELQHLRSVQNAYLHFQVQHADNLWDSNDPKQRDMLRKSRSYRLAAKLLGVDEKQHPWVRSNIAAHNSCPRCGARILDFVEMCGICSTDLVVYFTDRNITVDPNKWPGVAREIERRLEAATAPESKEKQNV